MGKSCKQNTPKKHLISDFSSLFSNAFTQDTGGGYILLKIRPVKSGCFLLNFLLT